MSGAGCMPVLTAAQMRRADALAIEAGVPALELMRRAGEAVARTALEAMPDSGRIVIVTGAGNNGGDGFAAAAWLASRRVPVTVLMLRPRDGLRGEAAVCADDAKAAGAKLRPVAARDAAFLEGWLTRAMLIVDAMLGIGARPVSGWWAEVVARINAADRPVLAVDVPSGLNADTGEAEGACVRADRTLPVAAWKWGHWLNEGPDCCGECLPPAEIGISPEMIRAAVDASETPGAWLFGKAALQGLLPPRPRRAHKGDFGHVWVLGGARGFTGAPRLAAMGALAAGAGLVSIACPEDAYPAVAAGCLEVMVHGPEGEAWQEADALVAGPGWGRAADRQAWLRRAMELAAPLVCDADALNLIAGDAALRDRLRRREGMTVLTPHPGEAARLLAGEAPEIEARRPEAVRALAREFGAWVVLKGVPSLIAAPDGRIWLNPFGSPALATAGSGDVLAGMIGAFLARRGALALPPERALPLAVALHGLAGEGGALWRAGQLPERVAGWRLQLESGAWLC